MKNVLPIALVLYKLRHNEMAQRLQRNCTTLRAYCIPINAAMAYLVIA